MGSGKDKNIRKYNFRDDIRSLYEFNIVTRGNLRSGSIFVSLGETFRREGRNEK